MVMMHTAVLRRLQLDCRHGNHNVSDVIDHLQDATHGQHRHAVTF